MAAKALSETDFPDGDLWVFGYGSLIWKPGFAFLEQSPARLIGEHRSLCIYSMVHRGTYERPGLVLGLDRGGACQGVAFRVAQGDRKATVAYLREREQVTGVYREVMRSVWLKGDAPERVRALAYVADRSHDQYAGRLSLEEQLRLVRQGTVPMATTPNTSSRRSPPWRHRACDTPLHRLAVLLKGGDTPLHRAS